MRDLFLQRIEQRPLVCDGAMGTMLYSKGISLNRCFDELNLSMPQLVKEVHVGYVKAGAEVIETNTFGANRFRLQRFNLQDRVKEVNLAGVRLAREVAGEDLYVAGSVGPLGVRLEPLGATSQTEARTAFREQIAALVEGGVDLIIIETMTDLAEARQALLAARDVSAIPVIVQMTIQDDGTTSTGVSPEDCARQLEAWGADLIGINCSVGPAGVLEALERMAAVSHTMLTAQPNAGLPRTVDGRYIYLSSPEYLASFAPRFIEAGARLLGGCCGTTPAHIRALKAAVKTMRSPRARVTVEAPTRPVRSLEPLPVEKRSRLAERLQGRTFPVVVEIAPPKGSDPTKEIEGAEYLLAHGVDAVNIPDSSGVSGRMSALTLAAILQQRVGVEVLLHYSTRNRSILNIQSELLGAHALGLHNILALTRDATQFSTPLDDAVFETDSVGLVNIATTLNRGMDIGGNPLGTQTHFLVGVSLNPYAVNPDEELRRFEAKVQAGANFAITAPVFDVERLAAFLGRIEHFGLPVIAAIWPLTSYRNAEFMNNEVPGGAVPAPILQRMRRADTDRAREEGLRIAQETLLAIRGLVRGVQIAAPFGRYALAIEVAQALGQRP